MKIKFFCAIVLVLIVISNLLGCETSDNRMESSLENFETDHTTNDNGTYTHKGNLYRYKLEVSGTIGDKEKSQVTFLILTNDTETRFEDVAHSLKTSEMSTGIPEFVILGWY